jgi:hypothetical protein
MSKPVIRTALYMSDDSESEYEDETQPVATESVARTESVESATYKTLKHKKAQVVLQKDTVRKTPATLECKHCKKPYRLQKHLDAHINDDKCLVLREHKLTELARIRVHDAKLVEKTRKNAEYTARKEAKDA